MLHVMGYVGSYLWKLRQRVGHELVLVPGAIIIVEAPDGRVLLTRRADDGTWCFPGGAAEVGSSFASTAVAELAEETGITVTAGDLVAFASLSDPELHTLYYPNGDVSQCFTLCFALSPWTGSLDDLACDDEVLETGLFAPTEFPSGLMQATTVVMDMYLRFRETGVFQVN